MTNLLKDRNLSVPSIELLNVIWASSCPCLKERAREGIWHLAKKSMAWRLLNVTNATTTGFINSISLQWQVPHRCLKVSSSTAHPAMNRLMFSIQTIFTSTSTFQTFFLRNTKKYNALTKFIELHTRFFNKKEIEQNFVLFYIFIRMVGYDTVTFTHHHTIHTQQAWIFQKV